LRSFAGLCIAILACLVAVGDIVAGQPSPRPNILWLVAEDISAGSLACYGNPLARTPTIDAFAARSVVFDRCFANPVCATSRFALITGMHAASCGPAHHHRAEGRMPPDVVVFPAILRAAGYYTTNNAKTDYNAPVDGDRCWDASGGEAHYRNRCDPKQPFFAVFNHEVTHESCLFPDREVDLPFAATDPTAVRIPPYQPDTPEIRADWARHANHFELLDRQIRRHLDDLEADGLADDTIVFFYADNGGVTPRSKRCLQAAGTRVPLVVYVPPKWRHLAAADAGARVSDPVGFVDFAATVLAAAGLPRTAYMQGRPFAGTVRLVNEQVFCYRDRMDERYDMSRSVMDRRWLYIRNFRPDIPAVQPLAYMFQARGYQSWARLARDGGLTSQTARFWGRKPAEELYDLDADPDNATNLANEPAHRAELERLRQVLRDHMIRIVDNGLLPEGSSLEGYAASRRPGAFPVVRTCDVAVIASNGDPADLPEFVAALDDPSEPIRWWAAQGCTVLAATRGADAVTAEATAAIERKLTDESPAVCVAAAEALARVGHLDLALPALGTILRSGDRWAAVQAANVLDRLGDSARPLLPELRDTQAAINQEAARKSSPNGPDGYVHDLVAHLLGVLEGRDQPLVHPDLR
jgi:arylsulfatase A-like enzyme